MYIIINKTDKEEVIHKGTFPFEKLNKLLDNDKDLIVINMYNSFISTPYLESRMYGENQWGWKRYSFTNSIDDISNLYSSSDIQYRYQKWNYKHKTQNRFMRFINNLKQIFKSS